MDGWTDGQFNYFLEMDIIQELFPLFMYSNDKLRGYKNTKSESMLIAIFESSWIHSFYKT